MPLSPAALRPLLRVALTPGIGPQRLSVLLRHFGSADRVLGASARELSMLPGMSPALAGAVLRHAGPAGEHVAGRALDALRRHGAVTLTPDDLAYPDGFRALPDPPYLLFAAGRLELLGVPGVAMVGTRSPSRSGRSAARALASGLARHGLTVISGMARGIDTESQSAALDAGGGTVGVLGHGIDRVYPPENHGVFERVRVQGLLLTEYPPGEGPKAGNFPRRNRLIAALSRAVVVVEMGARSGAQHTVTYALEQGKEVMAVPGPIGTPASAGSNELLRDGARVVTCAEDIVEELDGVGAPRRVALAVAREVQPLLPLLTPDEERVMEELTATPRHVDELGERTALVTPALLAVLLELEVKGAVEALPGMRYRRAVP